MIKNHGKMFKAVPRQHRRLCEIAVETARHRKQADIDAAEAKWHEELARWRAVVDERAAGGVPLLRPGQCRLSDADLQELDALWASDQWSARHAPLERKR